MTPRAPQLVVVDDDRQIRDLVGRFGRRAGFEVIVCAGGREGIAQLMRTPADLALIDLQMPDVGGLDVLRAIRGALPACGVILMTGYATIDTAVEAIKLGALDYLTKPLDFDRLRRHLDAVREETDQRSELMAAESSVARRLEFCGMIGRSPCMHELFGLVRRLAPHVTTVLITGETGTGKELVARALYHLGARSNERFISVNCSAVVETLFESELFGHVRGAFTGAIENKPGMFELANGGTLFLDEIGELPLSLQAKLLRVLETGEIQRVGSSAPHQVDVHICAASNRNLRAAAAEGRFRSDLFFRLSVVELHLPPLRDRREDIPYLVAAFLQEASARLKKGLIGLTASAESALVSARWDGNVRELHNVVERACILAEGPLVSERDLTGVLQTTIDARPAGSSVAQVASRLPSDESPDRLSVLERNKIVDTLRRVGGNKKAAAELLGLSRRALYRRIEHYALAEFITPHAEARAPRRDT